MRGLRIIYKIIKFSLVWVKFYACAHEQLLLYLTGSFFYFVLKKESSGNTEEAGGSSNTNEAGNLKYGFSRC